MTEWQLKLADRQTNILIEINASQHLFDQLVSLKGHQVLLLTDEHIAPLHLQRMQQQLSQYCQVVPVVLPAGEETKNLDQVKQLYTILMQHQFTRTDAIVALGGGVIGDLGALVASTYMRGMTLVQVPTTIIAQSDSSIGGKTAIDFQGIKNLIGTFYPAQTVIVDPKLLLTLPKRDLAAGMVEIIKCLLISSRQPEDAQLLEQLLLATKSSVRLSLDLLAVLVTRGLQIKSALVSRDFYDYKERRYLNFGHTIGHAVEALAQGDLLHGEAVGIGMIALMRAAVDHHELPLNTLVMTETLFKQLALPTEIPRTISHEAILARTRLDKKADDYGLTLVKINDVGQPFLVPMTHAAFKKWLGW